MEKKLSFNEVLPMEELAPVELNAIVGGTMLLKSLVPMDIIVAVETQLRPQIQHP